VLARRERKDLDKADTEAAPGGEPEAANAEESAAG
jgi:hypothetical protein